MMSKGMSSNPCFGRADKMRMLCEVGTAGTA